MAEKQNVGKNAPAKAKPTAADRKAAKEKLEKKRAAIQKKAAKEQEALDHSLKALELRKAGYTYLEIAKALKFSNGGAAYKAVQRAMKEVLIEPVKELKEMELARLDEMFNGVWPQAIQGNQKAIQTALLIMARRAKMMGMDQDNLKFEGEGAIQLLWDAPSILQKETPITRDDLKQKSPK